MVPWQLAGWITGAVPAFLGPRTVFATIAAVETFVNQHYQHQLDKLVHRPQHASLYSLLTEIPWLPLPGQAVPQT